MEKTALILCSGCGIGDALDFDAVSEVAGENGAATTLVHECLCAPEGLEALKATVSEHELDGVLVCACSERAKTEEFESLGFDASSMYRIAFREHCTWSHPAGEEDTQMLAEDLVRMGFARMQSAKPIEPLAEDVDDTVLVVGGGRAGMEAALAAAGMGHSVVLVEKTDALGGRLAAQLSVFPEEPPYEEPQENTMPKLIEKLSSNDHIKVLTSTTIEKIHGQPGQFKVNLNGSSGLEVTVGSIVQATGATPYDAGKLGHLGYGASPDVVTSQELEKMLVDGRLSCPSDGRTPQRVIFVQCAGSRDPDHLVYCSSECCATTLRQVAEIKKIDPKIQSAVVYKDIRTPGHMEYFFLGVQNTSEMMMTRGDVERVEANGRLSVRRADPRAARRPPQCRAF
jgi:quinone-modifying oxidoreductase subunit QmoB